MLSEKGVFLCVASGALQFPDLQMLVWLLPVAVYRIVFCTRVSLTQPHRVG
jgi:hypothetical protein